MLIIIIPLRLLTPEIKTGYDVLLEDENCGYLKPTIQETGISQNGGIITQIRLDLIRKSMRKIRPTSFFKIVLT